MTAEQVLVVDDEASIIQLARLYLERDGYQVLTAGDGLSALKSAAEEKERIYRADKARSGQQDSRPQR